MNDKQISKRCVKLVKNLNSGLDDPITEHYGVQDVIYDSYRAQCRKLGMSPEEVSLRADTYLDQRRERRLRFKNPLRLRWREREGMRRAHESPW